jgi:hypothetical protein
MSSLSHEVTDEATREHSELGLRGFTRLERLLLFAVISECERCIRSEGYDCFDAGKRVGCPFVSIREEYSITDIIEWRELVR